MPQYITDLLKPISDAHNRTLRSSVSDSLAVPRSRTSLFDRSYSYSAPKMWRLIPIPERNLALLCSFKENLKQKSASVAQLDAPSDWRPGGRGFNPRRGRQHSFVEIDHEIFSTVILSLPLIQEGQLSVSGERMCTVLVNHLED